MKDMIKLGGILLLVTTIASAVLAFVNEQTKPLIEEQARLAKELALTEAMPLANKDAIIFKEAGYYIGYKTTAKEVVVGYVTSAYGKGYSGVIETLVGIDTTGIIQGMKIIRQTETPGLGTKIEEIRYGEKKPWFQQQFMKLSLEKVHLKKNKPTGQIDAITGATISSQAVTGSVQKSVSKLIKTVGIKN